MHVKLSAAKEALAIYFCGTMVALGCASVKNVCPDIIRGI